MSGAAGDMAKDALRKGWTTGACAAAAAAAAYEALTIGTFPDPVRITLPGGREAGFPLASHHLGHGEARASVIKDAGDDPDVTHGAEIVVTVKAGEAGSGVVFRAGEGVGTVTKAGLPVAPGEPAINPRPREIMTEAIRKLAWRHDGTADVVLTIGVVDGEALARRTWNPRLGIKGGLSILGTTGIVIPYSCSAWIHAIHRGIDVARAEGLEHLAGATGRTSETAVRSFHSLPEASLIDMGDFAGGMLKYLRRHPVPRVSLAGGFAKMTKLAQGALDLHSARSQVDFGLLATMAREAGADAGLAQHVATSTSAGEALGLAREAGLHLADQVAGGARQTALATLAGGVAVDVIVIDRSGTIVGQAGP